jgi:hypothetical protein
VEDFETSALNWKRQHWKEMGELVLLPRSRDTSRAADPAEANGSA